MGWTREKKKKIQEFDDRAYPDVMLDIETLGRRPRSVVLSIGAVRWRMGAQDDVKSIVAPFRCFYRRLDDQEQRTLGREVDSDTLEWWDTQSDEAKTVFDEEPDGGVAKVLKDFTKFCTGAKRIWGNGSTFDNVIMKDLYEDYKLPYPVFFSQDMDMRTAKVIWNFLTNWGSKGKTPHYSVGVKHNALSDAQTQVLQLQHMLIKAKGSKYES